MSKKQIFLILCFFLLATATTYAQMFVGGHLNDIKKEHPFGSLLKNEDYGYTYGVTKEREDDYYLFFVNQQLYCYLTVLHPLTPTSLQGWIETLNKKWVVVDNYHWRFYRADGRIMVAELRRVDNVEGLCLGFTLVPE